MQPRALHRLRFADGGELRLGLQTVVMGVINVTPDSFSDGGLHLTPERALAAARAMARSGAALVDVGGESTRPGAEPVSEAEETRRVVPVVEALDKGLPELRLSVDTRRAAVARAALDAGADLVNDVSGFGDPEMLPLLAGRRVPAIVMHMRGTPRTMQHDTRYADLIGEVAGYLEDRVHSAAAAGLGGDKIIVDPGIGFGKSTEGNLAILKELSALAALDRPILVGASRKSFIGRLLDVPVEERLEGSLAVAAWAAAAGSHIVRVHDVAETVRVVRMIDAIRTAGAG